VEPIAYLRAPLSRWPIIIPLALVGLIIAILIPVSSGPSYPANAWQATAEIGLAPAYTSNKLGAKLGLKQLAFFAHSPAVIATAAKSDGVRVTGKLKNDVLVTKSRLGGKSGVLEVAVLQQTKAGAVSLTNSFVAALEAYAQVQIAATYAKLLSTTQADIQNLETAINNLPKATIPLTTPTTTPQIIKKKVIIRQATTTAKIKKAIARAQVNASTSLLASENEPDHPRLTDPEGIILVATSPAATTTPPTTTTTTAAATTSPALPGRATAQERTVLADDLGGQVALEQKLMAQGVPKSGFTLISSAQSSSAFQLNSNSSPLSNGWTRALFGLLLGALVGVAATWYLDGIDRRLRTTKRAEETFGLPIVCEIPAPESPSLSVIPVVDVVVDPYSPISEAYRYLHVAILTAPPVTWIRRNGAARDGHWETTSVRQGQDPILGSPAEPETSAPVGGLMTEGGEASTPAGGENPTAQFRWPVALMKSSIAQHPSRFSILVTSPSDEPTRSLVVVNLAAVFAEAGERVLVATTGGMRTEIENEGAGSRTWGSSQEEPDARNLVANARPSQIPGVSSLALGQLYSNPSMLVPRANLLVQAAREVVDVLLLEAPLLSTQDGAALLPAVDLVVVVCESWKTTTHDGMRVKRLLAQRRPPVLGLVMTNTRMERPQLLVGLGR